MIAPCPNTSTQVDGGLGSPAPLRVGRGAEQRRVARLEEEVDAAAAVPQHPVVGRELVRPAGKGRRVGGDRTTLGKLDTRPVGGESV